MNFDDDSIIGRFIQRWAFIAQVAVVLLTILWVLQTIYEFPSYAIRWYQTDEPKESNYFGVRCLSMLLGVYSFVLITLDMIYGDFVSTYWPTLCGLIFGDPGMMHAERACYVVLDCLVFSLTAWGSRKYADKLGFLEADPETGMAVFYPNVFR
jgi:prepilin signal peptidase PulO-like enzyme (type II secretory pathway)